MSKLTIQEILEAICSLSVIETCELSKLLTEKFDLPAAVAPVAMVGTQVNSAAEEKQTEFSVVITAVGENKISAIKSLRKVSDAGLKEAKEYIDAVASGGRHIVASGIDEKAAKEIKAQFDDSGATVVIE